jgi:hypothetical protein
MAVVSAVVVTPQVVVTAATKRRALCPLAVWRLGVIQATKAPPGWLQHGHAADAGDLEGVLADARRLCLSRASTSSTPI